MSCLNRHIIACSLYLLYKLYSLGMQSLTLWSLVPFLKETIQMRSRIIQPIEILFIMCVAIAVLTLVIQVIFGFILLVRLFKKNIEGLKTALKPCIISLFIECISTVCFCIYIVVQRGYINITIKDIYIMIMEVSFQVASIFMLFMIRRYYLLLRKINAANIELEKPKFMVLL